MPCANLAVSTILVQPFALTWYCTWQVRGVRHVVFESVAAGAAHTVAVTNDGAVYTTGRAVTTGDTCLAG